LSNSTFVKKEQPLDKNERKRVKHEYALLVTRIGRVLKRFAPIDESDEYSYGDEYEPHVGSIVSMLVRGCTRDELYTKLEAIRVGEYQLRQQPQRDMEIADAVITAFQKARNPTSRKKKKPTIVWRLDLRRDFNEVLEHIADRVRTFIAGKESQRKGDVVHLIEAGFEVSQNGWFVIVFDTRPNAQPDGNWTTHIENLKLDRIHWVKAQTASMRGQISIINADGEEATFAEGAGLGQPIGDLIGSVLLKARRDGVFDRLPLAPNFQMSIEDFDGEYDWLERAGDGQASSLTD
jgi:hypothetical protein